jgi:hypothetical protein
MADRRAPTTPTKSLKRYSGRHEGSRPVSKAQNALNYVAVADQP